MIDTYHCFETPEGVELHLNIAGPVVRAYAFLIDLTVKIVIQIMTAIFLGSLGKLGMAVMLLLFFLLEWFYPVFFEVFRSGQTPGKMSMGIRVVCDDGTSIGWSISIIRNLLRVADFLPFMYIIGIISMTLNCKFQRLGDLAAGSLVVYADSKLKVPQIPADTPKNFPVPLSLEEQQAIIGLAERSTSLSTDRIKELANIFEDIIDVHDEDAVKRIFQVANGFLGVK